MRSSEERFIILVVIVNGNMLNTGETERDRARVGARGGWGRCIDDALNCEADVVSMVDFFYFIY